MFPGLSELTKGLTFYAIVFALVVSVANARLDGHTLLLVARFSCIDVGPEATGHESRDGALAGRAARLKIRPRPRAGPRSRPGRAAPGLTRRPDRRCVGRSASARGRARRWPPTRPM